MITRKLSEEQGRLKRRRRTPSFIYIDMGSTFRQINDSDLLSGLRVVLDKGKVNIDSKLKLKYSLQNQ